MDFSNIYGARKRSSKDHLEKGTMYNDGDMRLKAPSPGFFSDVADRPNSRSSGRISPYRVEGELPRILRQRQSIVTFLLAEKELSPEHPQRKKRRKQRGPASWNVLGRILGVHGRAFLVVIGQTALLAVAWALFIFVILRGPTALPSPAADFAQANPRLLVVVITLLSTAFSALSSMLFSFSIAYALNFYLTTTSISIYQLGASISIMNRLPLLRFQRPLWTIASLLTILMTSCLVACWTTLLIPTSIVTQTHVRGVDLNLRDETFLRNAIAAIGSNETILDDLPHISGLVAAGIQAGRSASTWKLNEMQFQTNTAGIYPPRLDMSAIYSVSLEQTGYTSAVTCRSQSLSDPFVQPIRPYHAIVSGVNIDSALSLPDNTTRRGIDIWRWTATCPNRQEVSTMPYYSLSNSTFGLILCPVDDEYTTFTLQMKTTGPLEQSLGDFICNLDPYLTSVHVNYEDSVSIQEPSPFPRTGTSPTLANYTMSSLIRRFESSQTLSENAIAHGFLAALNADANGSLPPTTQQPNRQLLARMMESYLKAHVDASMTILRSQILLRMPSSQGQELTGTSQTKTTGFASPTGAFTLILLPITLIPLTSLLLILLTEIQRRKALASDPFSNSTSESTLMNETMLEQEREFQQDMEGLDFLNPFHFLSVVSAGGMTGACGGRLRDELLALSFGTQVRLGKVQLPGESEDVADVGLIHVEYGEAI